MKKNSFWQALRFGPCLLFLAIVTSLFLRNGSTFLQYTQENLPTDYKRYTQGIEKYISENLAGNQDYINLNGYAAKLLGLNTLNECFRLENGYLANFTNFGDVIASADNIKDLSDFLMHENIDFLYAYLPAKEHSFDAHVPIKYEHHNQHDKVVELSQALDDRNVNQLNLDAWFAENGWKMEDIYFRTDHHWLPEAAFTSTQLLMERLAQFGNVVYEKNTLNPENWTFKIFEDSFLGSSGRKTGQAYAGIDDFCFIYPNYPVQSYVGRVNPDRTMPTLDTTTVYRSAGLEDNTVYQKDSYGVYLGNNYPYIYIRNDLAVNQKKILIIGDSYRLPVECFLTTQFSEIFHVDMREYKDGSFSAFAMALQPDLVLYIGCIPVFNDVQNFGLEEWDASFGGKTLGQPCLEVQQISFGAAPEDSAFSLITDSLTPGAYELTLDQASLGGSLELIQFALMDSITGEVSCARYFLTEYEESQQWLFTVPEGGDYKIAVYHGMPGAAQDKAVTLDGITLRPFV